VDFRAVLRIGHPNELALVGTHVNVSLIVQLRLLGVLGLLFLEAPASLRKLKPTKDDEFGSTGGEAVYLSKLRKLLAKMEPDDQKLLLHMAQKVGRG